MKAEAEVPPQNDRKSHLRKAEALTIPMKVKEKRALLDPLDLVQELILA